MQINDDDYLENKLEDQIDLWIKAKENEMMVHNTVFAIDYCRSKE